MQLNAAILMTVPAGGLVLFAASRDIATRSVPNWISGLILICGLMAQTITGHLLASVLFGLIVLAAATPIWLWGWLGGADVKLLSAATVLLPAGAVGTLVTATAFAGGILAAVYIGLSRLIPRPAPGPRTGFLRRVLKAEAWRIHRRGPLPYATAIAAGVLFTLFHS